MLTRANRLRPLVDELYSRARRAAPAPPAIPGITTIEQGGAALPFEPAVNFSATDFAVANNPGNGSNDVVLRSPIVGGGTIFLPFGARPLASSVRSGTIFVPTDGPLSFISNGSSWLPYFGGVQFPGVQVPPAALFTEIAAGQSTLVDAQGTLRADVTLTNADIWQYNPALGGTFTIDTAFECLWAHDGGGADQPVTGLALRDNGSGHFYRTAMYYDRGSGFHMQVQRFTALGAPGTVISDILNTGIMHTAGPVRFRVQLQAGTYALFTTQDGGTFGSPQVTWTTEVFANVTNVGLYVEGGNGSAVDIPTRYLSLSIGP